MLLSAVLHARDGRLYLLSGYEDGWRAQSHSNASTAHLTSTPASACGTLERPQPRC